VTVSEPVARPSKLRQPRRARCDRLSEVSLAITGLRDQPSLVRGVATRFGLKHG
jgi:hypothetical protein